MNNPGMRQLVDAVEFQGWGHLFEWPVPFLHEWEVKGFQLNMEIQENGSFITKVGELSVNVDEDSLSKILQVKKVTKISC